MVVKLLSRAAALTVLAVFVEGMIFFCPVERAAWENSYLAAWRVKHQRLIAPGDNRLIVAGGSNVAFGVDSSTLQSVTQRTTINMGLHGGLGLRSVLYDIEENVRDHDTVV